MTHGCQHLTPAALYPRDLAEQTHDNMTAFARHLQHPALRSALLVGGTNSQQALRAIKEGVDIITGTPGGRESEGNVGA